LCIDTFDVPVLGTPCNDRMEVRVPEGRIRLPNGTIFVLIAPVMLMPSPDGSGDDAIY
jgi:hypothetical protein